MGNKFGFDGNPGSNPAMDGAAITPNDSTDLPSGTARSIYVGTGGHVAVTTYGGTVLLFKNVASGSTLPVAAKRVMATNTTAADMVALY